MRHGAISFPYLEVNPGRKPSVLMPLMPLTLMRKGRSAEIVALVDTGAATNVLPHRVGLQLGAKWEELSIKLSLTGNLAGIEARALVVSGKVGNFPPTELVFAWALSDSIPVILGQTNFLMEYDACFYRSQSIFEIAPALRGQQRKGRK
jgi:hypothetical protein